MESQIETKKASTIEPGLVSAAAVGVGVALLAPELFVGVALGAGAAMAPKLFPQLGAAMRPLAKEAIKYGLAVTEKAQECLAEATEQVQDLIAEVRFEQEVKASPPQAQADSRQEAESSGPTDTGNTRSGEASS